MAIIGTQDDEENKNVIAQPTTSSSPNAHAAWDSASGAPYQGASGGSGLVGGSGTGNGQGMTTGGAASTGPASPNPGGGGFTNLSQYLAVNQGTGGTTGQAAGNVATQAGDAATTAQNAYNTAATGDIKNATSAAGVQQGVLDKVTGGQQNVDQATMDKIAAGGYNYQAPASFSLAGLATESKENLDSAIKTGADSSKWSYGGPTDFSKVQYGGPSIDQITTQYGGPNTVADFQGDTAGKQSAALSANEIAAGKSANAKGGQAGVASLLRDAYQQPNYTKGENNLDAFLAGGTTGGQEALGKAAGVGDAVSKSYGGIQDLLSKGIQGGKDTATATNKAYQDSIDKATAASNATRDKYGATVEATKKSSADAQKAAQDAAKTAQGEEDKRAAAAAAAAAEQARIQAEADKAADIQKQKDSVLGKLETEAKKVGIPILSDLKNLPNNLAGLPKNLADQIKGALAGDQASLNALTTTILSGGLSTLAPAMTKGVTDTAAKARTDTVKTVSKAATDTGKAISKGASDTVKAVTNAPQTVVNTVQNAGNKLASAGKSIGKKLGFAHGGEIPEPRKSYGALVAKLRGRK